MIRCWLAALVCLCIPLRAAAQIPSAPAAPHTFTFADALQYAADHYPTVRAAIDEIDAASAGVRVAQTAHLPRLDSMWQSNRGTANNVFGQVLPQSVLPSLTGPVLPAASADSVWGIAVGALFSWEPIDLGLRRATIGGAEASVARARADEALVRLSVQSTVGAAFLDVLTAQRAVTAAQADMERRDVLSRAVHTLVENQLRPGAEASRADAERAAARTRVIQARQGLRLAEITMARLLGIADGTVTADGAALLERMPPDPAVAAALHPLARVRQAGVDAARAQQAVLAHTDQPRLFVESSLFARGSGASPTGQLDGSLAGLGLDRINWAAGVQVQLPNVFDLSSLRARKSAAAASERAQAALYDEALLTITGEQRVADAMVEAARAIAANTPIQLEAAQQSEAQARARYQAGLASIVEIADAQDLLARAESDDQLARVDIWRALLAQAAARGSLSPLLAIVPSTPGGR